MLDSLQIPAPAPQFDTAANPKLENPAFDGGTDWTTEGKVSFAHNAATLSETAATQTRLNQVFVLGEHDRFLSFTLKNDLQANGNGSSPIFAVNSLRSLTFFSLPGQRYYGGPLSQDNNALSLSCAFDFTSS